VPVHAARRVRRERFGLLGRRHVAIDSIAYIGKESKRLEEVEERSLLDPTDVYTDYPDPERDEWVTKILPRLNAMRMREACEGTGISRAQMQRYRNKGARPHAEHLEVISNSSADVPKGAQRHEISREFRPIIHSLYDGKITGCNCSMFQAAFRQF
jgi:hypothetical protein